MTSAVRFSAAHGRMHALKSRLWTPLDRPLLVGAGLMPDGTAIGGAPREVFPGLVHWFVTFIAMYPSADLLWRALFRRHEVENLKLLWRAAVRGRAPIAACWRPLDPLAAIEFPPRAVTPQELVHRLATTPYGAIARALLRSHAGDLPATEIGLDRWIWDAVDTAASRLPTSERAAARLIRALVLEHDVELLHRGTSVGLDPDLVAKSTVVLSRECRIDSLSAAAAWRPEHTSLSRVLPRTLTRITGGADDWDAVRHALRSAQLRACRRAFVGWPFRLAPAIAALMLREEQVHAAVSIAAARAAGRAAQAGLPLALAASALEA